MYNFNDKNFKNTDIYKNYLIENPALGYLKIRASAASSAVPIENLKITVKKTIDDIDIIFFEGLTNNSGTIEKIDLPAPPLTSDLVKPNSSEYDIEANYNNQIYNYKVKIYENILVVQNMNIIPDMNKMGDF